MVGVFHLIDRLLVLGLFEFLETPVTQHPRVEKILIDCCQFVREYLVQMIHYRGIAFHEVAPDVELARAWDPLPAVTVPHMIADPSALRVEATLIALTRYGSSP